MDIFTQDLVSIPHIIKALKEGKTIVYPTETCYGLGCDATNGQAVDKIFEIKHRQKDKPLLVIADNPSIMMDYVDWNITLEKIAERYWPGPLTVVVRAKNDNLPPGVRGEDGTIAFRITDHTFAAELSRELGKPIVSTSANISSYASPYDVMSVLETFEKNDVKPDIVINAGTLPEHAPSTIIRLTKDGEFFVLRQGEVIVKL